MSAVYDSLLDTMFGRMPMGLAVFDREMRLVRCNANWSDFAATYASEKPVEVKPGTHVLDLFPNTADWVLPAAERVFAGETLRFDPIPLESRGTVTYWDMVIAPLYEDGKVTGAVEIASNVTDRVLARQELEDRVRERTAEIERRQEVSDGLHFILDTLNSCCPTEEVTDFIISEAGRLLGTDAISVYRIQVTDGVVSMETQRGFDSEAVAALTIPVVGGGHVASTLVQGKPMVMPDVAPLMETASRQLPVEQQIGLGRLLEKFRSILAVPMIIGDEVFGALAMFYPEPREFSREDIALAEDLADHLALALENARLRETAEESAASAERSRLARDLHDAVTQTLFSAGMIAEVLPQLWERDPEEGQKRLAQLRNLTRGALAEMRTLLLELRPAALEEAALPDLLQQLGEAAQTRASIDVDICTDGEIELP
ncbi:MAG: histidine kinase, partial [Coriobacteriia bacterium]|nr:histidine kinase [Coriobacteriia bacterium]